MLKKLQFLLLIVSIIIASCGPRTRIITPLSESDRMNIKKVAIHITVDEELDAKMSTMKSRFWPELLNGWDGSCVYGSCLLLLPVVIGVMITEETVRSSMDHGRESEFNEDISDINMKEV